MDNYHKATPERKDLIEKLLDGAIDLHCHSGPSVMPRSIDHIEVAEEASKVGMKAILYIDHYYSPLMLFNGNKFNEEICELKDNDLVYKQNFNYQP